MDGRPDKWGDSETDRHRPTQTDTDIQKEREKCGAILVRTSVTAVKREIKKNKGIHVKSDLVL